MSARLIPLGLLAVAACAKPRPPLAVVITMESVRADWTSAGHSGWATTDTRPPKHKGPARPDVPANLDDLAYDGVRFANAFAPSGSPLASLASMLTGRPPDELGVYADFDHLEGFPTIAESLAARGVRCAAFVGRRALAKPCGLARGFEVYEVADDDAGAVARARAWLDAAPDAGVSVPAFLWLHLAGTRPPFVPDKRDIEVIDYFAGLRRELATFEGLERLAHDPAAATLEERAALAALEAAGIRGAARKAAELLAAARARLEPDVSRGLVVFAGTNGEEGGERGPFGSRRTLRDATLHVPLFLWQGSAALEVRVASPLVELGDLAPTLARHFDAPLPADGRGRDLIQLLDDPRAAEHATFASWEGRIFTVRTARHRLICNPLGLVPGGWPSGPLAFPPEQLFDVERDPAERADLAATDAATLQRMEERLAAARRAISPRPPAAETDAARLEALRLERTHAGDRHPAEPAPSASCGASR